MQKLTKPLQTILYLPGINSHSCREAIRRTAKTLVEDTKNLVSAAQASQDVLASAAQSAVGSVSNLADNVKLGAIALGSDDSNAQV